jgi:hypothetical protein
VKLFAAIVVGPSPELAKIETQDGTDGIVRTCALLPHKVLHQRD